MDRVNISTESFHTVCLKICNLDWAFLTGIALRVGECRHPCIFGVCGRITVKVCTGVDNQGVTSIIEKDFQESSPDICHLLKNAQNT